MYIHIQCKVTFDFKYIHFISLILSLNNREYIEEQVNITAYCEGRCSILYNTFLTDRLKRSFLHFVPNADSFMFTHEII